MDELLHALPLLREAVLAPVLLLAPGLWLARRARPVVGHALLAGGVFACLLALPAGALARELDLGWFGRTIRVGGGPLPEELWGPAPGDAAGEGLIIVRVLGGLWLAAAAALGSRLVHTFRHARRSAHCGVRVDEGEIADAVHELAARLSVAPPRIVLDPAVRSPRVWGLGAGILLLPTRALDLAPEQLRGVLGHELAHLARRDAWSRLASELLCVLLPFQPLVWRARREQSRLAELACDDWARALGARGTSYAQALLDLARGERASLAPALSGERGLLRERIARSLAGGRPRPVLGRRLRGLLPLALTCALAGLALARTRAPRLERPPARAVPVELDRARFGPGPDVRLRPEQLDLGSASAAEEARGSLWIVNLGTRIRTVQRLQATCGCVTLSELRDLELAPGHAVEVPLTMRATAPPGEHAEKRVQVLVEGQPLLEATVRVATAPG